MGVKLVDLSKARAALALRLESLSPVQTFQERIYVHGTLRPHDENDMSGTRPMKKIDEPNNSMQLTALLYSIIFATASALGTASGAADS